MSDIKSQAAAAGIDLDNVTRMVNAMADTLETEAIGATSTEVVSAGMTMCLRIVKASIKLGADPHAVRRGVERILVECVDTLKPN